MRLGQHTLLGGLFVLTLLLCVAVAEATPAFPVVYSADARYLVDQNGVPFPILGRTAWFVTSLSVADYRTFIDDTAARGYTAIEFHVINHDPRGNNPPFNGNGDLPFLTRLDGTAWNGVLCCSAPDFTTPNEAYWSFVDELLAYAESKGLLVFMFPAYVGFGGGDMGWMQEMVGNGPAKMQTYGTWISTRYRNQKNLVWMMGGDFGTAPFEFTAAQTAVESALLTGLQSVAGQQSTHFSAEWTFESIVTDQPTFGPAMTLNGVYSWFGDVNNHARRAYARTPVMPAFVQEEPFDEEGPDGNNVNGAATQPVRRYEWWGWLSTIGGYIAGNGYVWPFNPGVWQAHLDSPGSRDLGRLHAFIRTYAWYRLVPSGLNGMRTLITAGGGPSVSAIDYVAAAATPDGALLIAYIPPAHTGSITVDMAAMSGPTRARWFDPTTATYTLIDTDLPNSGSHAFTPPGLNSAGDADWVLVLDVPGGVPDTTPPVRSNGLPTGVLAAGTLQTTLSLLTDENATCRWATSVNVPYASMPNTFDTTGGTAHSTLVTGLVNGGIYSRFIRCQDVSSNANTTDFTIAFSIAMPASLQFSVATYSVSEASATATITVKRTGPTSSSAQVHYETSDGTAVAGTDYTHAEGDLTFSSGQTSRTFSVPVTNNTIVDGPRTVLLQLSNPQNAQLGTQATAVLTIQNNDGGGIFRFPAAGYTYPDKPGYATITVTRSSGSASSASIQYRTGGGTAVPGTDYTAISVPQTLIFGPSESSRTFHVSVLGNSTAGDSTKTVQLLLSAPAGGATLGSPATAILRITNDDTGGGVKFGASSYSVAENADHGTVTVTRSGGAASAVSVQVQAVNGSAKAGLDYGVPTPSMLTFAANETSKIVDVPLIPNALATGTRSLTLKLQGPTGGASLSSPSTATLSITKVGIRFSQTAYTVNEGPGSATITVNRAGTASGVTVQVQTVDDTATAPADYAAISPPQTLTFSSGQKSKTFTVAIANNPIISVNRSLRVRLLNATGEPLGEPDEATLTILDKDTAELQLSAFTPPAVGLAGKTISVPNIVRNLSAKSAPTSTLRFVLSVDAISDNGDGVVDDVVLGTRGVGSLGSGSSSSATTTLTIPSSIAPGAYTLFAIVDANHVVPEQDEANNVGAAPLTVVANLVRTFAVSGVLTHVDCTSPLRNGRAVVVGSLTVSSQTGVSLTGSLALTSPLMASWKMTGSLTGSVDTDGHVNGSFSYTTKQGSLTVSNGSGALTGTVSGTTLEADLTGQSLSGETCDFAGWLAAPASPIGFVGFHHDATASSLDELDGQFVAMPGFPVPLGRYRVLFQVAGDASPFASPATVLFTGPPGSQLADTGGAEMSQLASNAAEYRSPWVASPPIAPAGDWTIAYEGQPYDATMPDPQAAAHLVVPVPTFAQSNGSLTRVDWAYRAGDGTALGGPPAFMRHIRLKVLDPCGLVLHDSLTLAPTTLSRVLTPSITLSRVAEVRFEYVDDGENLYSVRYGNTTPGNCKMVEFSAPSYSAAENVSQATITVRRAGDLTGTVTVHFTTSDGTAQQGLDYTSASQLVTLGPNVISTVVGVPILNNGLLQGPRMVLLRLTAFGGGALLGPLNTAVLTINDDDPRVRFSSTTYSVSEGATSATITVQRTGATAPVVSVPYSTSDGTALAGLDYAATAGTLTFASGQTSKTFTLPILPDVLAEGSQTVNLALGTPIGAWLAAPDTATLTITDNDTGGTLAFAAPTFSVAEDGAAVTITVIRTGGTGAGVTVHYATSNGTGLSGTDYDATSGTLTFGAKETSKTFTVGIHPNLGSSVNKSVTLTLSSPSPGSALGTPSTATLWIVSGN